MHRNRTWLLDPIELRTQRNRILPIEGGDGSTLSLDFTTGVLDPRLTFTRLSDATFINSSGLVQWADANHVQNSTMLNNTGTKWTQTTSGGTVTINGDGTVRFNGTGGRATWLQSIASLASGLPMTFSFRVTSFTNTNLRTTDLFNAGTGFTGQSYFYTDTTGTTHTLTAFESLPKSGTNGVGTYSVTATTNATSANIIFGSDCNGVGGRSGDVTITEPQLQYGTVVPRRAYVPNSSIIAAKWDSARFDHDPTTLAPRGLLIEGAATNLFNWSETFDTTGGATNWNWSVNVTRGTVTTTNPTGASATVIKVEETTTNGLHAPLTVPTVLASTPYTFSVWAKAVERTFVQLWENGGSGANSMVNLSTGAIVSESTAGITTVTAFGSTGWYRISMRLTTIVGQTTANCQLRLSTNGTTTSYAGTTGSGIYIWGAQLETGSASSYIPTGSGQGTRNADVCYMANADYGFSTSGGTYLAEWHRGSNITTGSTGNNAFATDYASGRWLGIYTTGAGSTGTAGSWSGYLNSPGAVSGINKMAVSYSSWVASASGNTSLNGGAIVSGTLTLGTTPTYLFVGAASGTAPYSGGGYRDPLNNCVRRIKYWPSVLPNAQLQSLTT